MPPTSPPTTLPGDLTVRPVTLADLEAAVDLFNECAITHIGRPEVTLDGIRNEWNLPDFDLAQSTQAVFIPDGRPVGYVEVWDLQAVPNRIWIWGRVHPNYEGRGIGSCLLDWAEERARQAVPRVPDGARVVYQVGTVSGYQPARQLFESRGLKLVRHFWNMQVDLAAEPEAPHLPGNLIIRSMIPQQEERAVLQAVRDSFQDHWGFVEQPFEEEFARWLYFIENDPDHDPALWLLAMAGDAIAGISLCDLKSNEDPAMGWVATLGVCRPWRRQGLGLALLQQSFRELYWRGQRRVGLAVDAASLTGATRLYEKAGMHVARRYDTYEKELRPGYELGAQAA